MSVGLVDINSHKIQHHVDMTLSVSLNLDICHTVSQVHARGKFKLCQV